MASKERTAPPAEKRPKTAALWQALQAARRLAQARERWQQARETLEVRHLLWQSVPPGTPDEWAALNRLYVANKNYLQALTAWEEAFRVWRDTWQPAGTSADRDRCPESTRPAEDLEEHHARADHPLERAVRGGAIQSGSAGRGAGPGTDAG